MEQRVGWLAAWKMTPLPFRGRMFRIIIPGNLAEQFAQGQQGGRQRWLSTTPMALDRRHHYRVVERRVAHCRPA